MYTERPKLVWDIDDVEAQTEQAILDSANRTFGLRLTPADFTEDFPAMVGRTRGATTEWWLGFCEMEFPTLEPMAGMPELHSELSNLYDQDQLTSRRSAYRTVTEAWTAQYYPGVIGTLHMATIDWDNDPLAHLRTKADDLADIEGAICLIDNEPKHCLAVAATGMWAVQFGPRLWRAEPTEFPTTYLRARCADELAEVLSGLLVAA